MKIDRNTRISKLINHNAAALDAIVAISPRFEKLRNPALRKLMAGRTSIGMAARVGGCTVEDFFGALEPLGFKPNHNASEKHEVHADQKPDFINKLPPEQIITLDVRPMLENGEDPFDKIMEQVNNISGDKVLKIINTFEPVPLIAHMKKQGFGASVEHTNGQTIETWFYKPLDNTDEHVSGMEQPDVKTEGWDKVLATYKNHLEEIDVRNMEMPMPMITILEYLETLHPDKALFVYHKRIPLFLLPELQQRNYDYRVKEISEEEVHVLIFKPSVA